MLEEFANRIIKNFVKGFGSRFRASAKMPRVQPHVEFAEADMFAWEDPMNDPICMTDEASFLAAATDAFDRASFS